MYIISTSIWFRLIKKTWDMIIQFLNILQKQIDPFYEKNPNAGETSTSTSREPSDSKFEMQRDRSES